MYKPFGRLLTISTIIIISGCATIVNDPTVPVGLSFSNGEEGECTLTNKRVVLTTEIPGTPMVRRSDDSLKYDCKTESGARATGMIPSSMEAEKIGASVLFIDLGITDAITDKHRTYPSNFVIPVR
jgi:hypothetical protein